jgi:type I restriction enzyme S subunit
MSNKGEAKIMKPKLRFPEFQDAEGWEESTVGRISNTVIAGGTPSTSEKNFWGGDVRWMNSGELNYKKVYEVQGRITGEGLSNSSTKLIPPRCVLIGLAGQGKTRGTVAMNMVELCTNQSIAAIFPNDSAFNSDFLYHDLDKRYDELRRLSAGGEGRGGLNLGIAK